MATVMFDGGMTAKLEACGSTVSVSRRRACVTFGVGLARRGARNAVAPHTSPFWGAHKPESGDFYSESICVILTITPKPVAGASGSVIRC